MPSSQQSTTYSVALPDSAPSPPSDLPSYARFMHQHTKRQMDAANRSNRRRSQNADDATSLPNGVSTSRSRSGSEYSHET